MEDQKIYFGDSIKDLGGGRLGGYLVRFGGPKSADLEGDFFTPDTDFGKHKTTPVFYQHAGDGVLKSRKLDEAATLTQDEIGIWIEAQLLLRDDYEKFIYEQAKKSKMGWSSGTASHLVNYKRIGNVWQILAWPLGLDASITPEPAEPQNSVIPLKSLSKIIPDLSELVDVSEAAETAKRDREDRTRIAKLTQLRARAMLALEE